MSIITIERKVLEKNDQIARRNRQLFKDQGLFVLNFVSSPGAGKTSILEKTFQELRDSLKMAVIEGDVQTEEGDDAQPEHGPAPQRIPEPAEEPSHPLLSLAAQDRLEAEGGACIMYTHFANEFYRNGTLNARFRQLMGRLAKKNGWFVPVSTLLDHLLAIHGHCEIDALQRRRLERKWLLEKLFVGTA